jgi:hypothetical protein
VRHKFEKASEHGWSEAPATDAEKKDADKATKEVLKQFEEEVRKQAGSNTDKANQAIQNVKTDAKPAGGDWLIAEKNLIARLGTLIRRPIAGPFWLGLLVGGLPSTAVLSRLAGREVSPELLRYLLILTPVTVFAAILGAVVGADCNWICLARRAFLSAAAACLPLPLAIFTFLGWQDLGLYVFSPKGFLVVIIIFLTWTVAAAISAWLIAVAVKIVANRRPRRPDMG